MYKKIINPKEELKYRLNSVDTRYILNEGNRSIGIFSATKGVDVPTQISPQDICFLVLEGSINFSLEDKFFELKENELILIPKTSAYTIKFAKDSKAIFIRV